MKIHLYSLKCFFKKEFFVDNIGCRNCFFVIKCMTFKVEFFRGKVENHVEKKR